MLNQFKNLQSYLENLPLEVGKVNLWLVFRNVKPMASIVLNFNWGEDENKQRLILSWFEKTEMLFCVSQKFSNTLHISKKQKALDLNKKYEMRNDFNGHYVRGLLYGFPRKAVEVYSREILKVEPIKSDKLTFAFHSPDLKNKYWLFYNEYFLRSRLEFEDSFVAKKWADLARKEIPVVAGQFESEMKLAVKSITVAKSIFSIIKIGLCKSQ